MMDNIREKLVKLIEESRIRKTENEGYCICGSHIIADHLIDHGVTVQEWIPVSERLPEIVTTKREWRNVYHKSDRVLCACLQKSGKQMVKEGYMEFFNDYPEPIWRITGTIDSVTHWMPLPTLPKGE